MKDNIVTKRHCKDQGLFFKTFMQLSRLRWCQLRTPARPL